jgi:hypothetical protein
MKRTSKNRWAVVELVFCDGDEGLSYEEAGVLHYIAKFEKRNGPVYASLPHISKDTRISERSVQRHIRKLIKLDFLHEKTTGRGRYLTANHAKMASIIAASLISNDAKMASTDAKVADSDAKMASTHAKMAPDPCQNGMLHIELPIEVHTEVTHRKEPTDPVLSFYKELGLVKDKSEPAKLSDAEEKAKKEREKAEYLQFKKSLLSKADFEPVDYSDVPE